MNFNARAITFSNAVEISKIKIPSVNGKVSARIITPTSQPANNVPLIACHGISRDAKLMTELFTEKALSLGRTIIVPYFDESIWPVFQRITKKHRPDRGLMSLITTLKQSGVIRTDKVHLFGYSGGAQLTLRFALLYPHLVKSLHLGAPGWFTLPDRDIPYPLGFGPEINGADIWGKKMHAGLDLLLRRPIHIYVGKEDTLENEPSLKRSASLDAAQGSNRLSRAHTFMNAMRSAAKQLSIEPDISLHELPGCGHDFSECFLKGNLGALIINNIRKCH